MSYCNIRKQVPDGIIGIYTFILKKNHRVKSSRYKCSAYASEKYGDLKHIEFYLHLYNVCEAYSWHWVCNNTGKDYTYACYKESAEKTIRAALKKNMYEHDSFNSSELFKLSSSIS